MAYYLLQKRPDGQTAWEDQEGASYNFARRLPNARNLCRNDVVLFYRPTGSGTPEDGCVFARATVAQVELGDRGRVDAQLVDYVAFRPVALAKLGDPRANRQHSFQPIARSFYERALKEAGADEGA